MMMNWKDKDTYCITYSCYTKKMLVLLNGKELLSQSSVILQYMNEPFYSWCTKLPELLYRELGEDYQLCYTGRPEEAKILRNIFGAYPHCTGFAVKNFVLFDGLKERMIALSRLMKEKQLSYLPERVIPVIFTGEKKVLQHWESLIRQLDVRNQYCRVKIQIIEISEIVNAEDHAVIFFISESDKIEKEEITEGRKYCFWLVEEAEAGFKYVSGACFVYGITQHMFFEVVFECLLLFPLSECFAEYVSDILPKIQDERWRRKVEILLSVKPCVYIKVPESIEEGTSETLEITMEPENAPIPSLIFEYQIPGIISCSTRRIYGEKAGKTRVQVYEKGSAEPLCEFETTVYKRKRIQSLLLSEYSQTIGVGDILPLTVSYSPGQADNVSSIQWYSSEEKIASVSSDGIVKALSPGKCRIYCAAEKISTFCNLEVKPYLIDFLLPFEVSEPQHFEIGERRQIECRKNPEGAIDGRLIFSSMNLMIANAENGYVTGVSDGETDIIIENAGKNIQKCFHVVVGCGNSLYRKPKKKFLGLFG
ncbi:Ig-like domain-containing protein [Blautia wexlerae]|uniref:Ig-like domain-containing protein n=1 Tax=Blautia wexlerae TaxID=418240 RepID=UPI0022DF9F78|nr:Ig-like domain-containing protein [Blautia wexlerae]